MTSFFRQNILLPQHRTFLEALEVAILTFYIFLSFALGFLKYPIAQGATIVLLVMYVILWLRVGGRSSWRRLSNILIALLLCATLIMPLTLDMYHHAQADGNESVLYHDGALQSDIAFSLFVKGENPYAVNYYDTELGQNQVYRFFQGTTILNPALEHYIYLPATFLLGGLASYGEKALFGFSDERFLYLLLFLGSVAFLYDLIRANRWRFAVLAAYALNPWTIHFLIQGRNDVLPIFFVIAAVWAIIKKKYIGAGISFGLALATKQFTWAFLPFLFMYLYVSDFKKPYILTRVAFVALGVAFIVIGPFFAWAPHAFIDDTLLYASGSSTGLNYPITGFGFSRLLTLFGVLDPFARFPFWLIMLPVGILTLAWGIPSLIRSRALSTALFVYAIWMFGTFFFARFFHDNYIVFIVNIALLGVAVWMSEQNLSSIVDKKI